MSYDNPIYQTITLPAAAVDANATLTQIVGPRGLKGRLVSIGSVVLNALTDAASLVEIGDGTSVVKYGSLSIPVSSANAVANNATISTSDSNLIAANSRVVISADGGATAGDADLTVTFAWF